MSPRSLPLADAEAGMVLATDIRDAGGAVLLAAGGALTEPLLAALRRRGIEQVTVSETRTLTEAEREARREAARVHLAWLFRRAGEAEADRLLFEAMLDYRLEHLE